MYDTVVSFNSENGMKVAKLPRDFDISRTTLTIPLKNKDKIISLFSLSEYACKYDTVGSNHNQRTLLTLVRLWH